MNQVETTTRLLRGSAPTRFRSLRFRHHSVRIAPGGPLLRLVRRTTPPQKRNQIEALPIITPGPPHKWTCGCTEDPNQQTQSKLLNCSGEAFHNPLCIKHPHLPPASSPEHKTVLGVQPGHWTTQSWHTSFNSMASHHNHHSCGISTAAAQ